MVRLFSVAASRCGRVTDTYLWSMGVTLLVLSVCLVPTNGLLADEGDGDLGGLVIAVGQRTCLANNGCANGCKTSLSGGACLGGYNTGGVELCNADATNCVNCPCRGCLQMSGDICNCQCQSSSAGCKNVNTCNANAN